MRFLQAWLPLPDFPEMNPLVTWAFISHLPRRRDKTMERLDSMCCPNTVVLSHSHKKHHVGNNAHGIGHQLRLHNIGDDLHYYQNDLRSKRQ
jgi:hypothetical protein